MPILSSRLPREGWSLHRASAIHFEQWRKNILAHAWLPTQLSFAIDLELRLNMYAVQWGDGNMHAVCGLVIMISGHWLVPQTIHLVFWWQVWLQLAFELAAANITFQCDLNASSQNRVGPREYINKLNTAFGTTILSCRKGGLVDLPRVGICSWLQFHLMFEHCFCIMLHFAFKDSNFVWPIGQR